MPNIDFDNGQDNGEVVFDDRLLGEQTSDAEAFDPGRENSATIAADGSQIMTKFDGQGNKVEKRCFSNHPTLKCLLITTAADGQREGVIYGQNGRTKPLPPDLLDRALTDPGSTIAQAAGIFETRKEKREALPVVVRGESPVQSYTPSPVTVPPVAAETSAPEESPAENKTSEPPTERKNGAPDDDQSQSLLQRQINQAGFRRQLKKSGEPDKTLD